ncbi:AAA family ATPase [Acinetobacter baumannii]|uniref:AAA family ATPase n=1 Tax=Acinetobacter baumannii TaxID=470 RepID=UPI0027FE128B|nr:AAA family ATPase [Acinetobacter baumannii]MDQ7845018.1 AAA family ATPase [Acinetobacter baumannii]
MTVNQNETIACEICEAQVHSIPHHLNTDHPKVTFENYKSSYPNAPTQSPALIERIRMKAEEQKKKAQEQAAAQPAQPSSVIQKPGSFVAKDTLVARNLHEIFEISGPEGKNAQGDPIPVSCIENSSSPDMVPEINNTYVFEIDVLKNTLIALELNIPFYVWGHKGTGKTELIDQVAARTGRPVVRIQHTANTEEAHIVGMWTVVDGNMTFQLGPLALAMKHGWLYLADEYDFAQPSVLSVYQAVMEGKPLNIKEADPENRIIKPHPNFRFCATGNTNGTGDETGLYSGTTIQNTANYDRFGMVMEKHYMSKEDEAKAIVRHTQIDPIDAKNLVEFATKVRAAYSNKEISDTISLRSLIYAAKLGVMRGSMNTGISLAYANKQSSRDYEIVKGIAQRVFG